MLPKSIQIRSNLFCKLIMHCSHRKINAAQAPIQTKGSRRMEGTPVSQGTAVATARVVMSLDDAHQIEKGDILITYATDIGWSPYFPLLSGIVTELGGLISHGENEE